MNVKRMILSIALCLGVGLSIVPAPKLSQSASLVEACAEVHQWIVTYVEPFRGHLLRVIVRDPTSSDQFPRVGYWITFPKDWVAEQPDFKAIVRGCQDTAGGVYTVEVKTEEGSWVSGAKLLVKKLSADWRKISFTVLSDPDDPSSVATERIIEIPR